MPETMAEKMKTMGMSGEDHHGIGFDGSEDESDIAVQQKSGGNADEGDELAEAFVDVQRALG